jgi:hypothetical protein
MSYWRTRAAQLRSGVQNVQNVQNHTGDPVLNNLDNLNSGPPEIILFQGAGKSSEPIGPWIVKLQMWGIDQARCLVGRLIAAAGPNRTTGLDELFRHMDKQWRWNGAR